MASRDVPFGEVALDSITRQEAKGMYDSLVRRGAVTPHVISMRPWSRFTTGDVDLYWNSPT